MRASGDRDFDRRPDRSSDFRGRIWCSSAPMRILVSGTAGFVGFHLAHRLLADGHEVFGVDGITPYYDQDLKRRRHAILAAFPRFNAREFMLEDAERLRACVAEAAAERVFHLAAQPGVRYSSENPRPYVN